MREGTLILDGREHAYCVRYTRRRTLGLYVSRDRGIEVRVPLNCPPGVIRSFLHERGGWLAATVARLAALPGPVCWADGSRHLYLGEPLTLAVRPGRRPLAVRDGERLLVSVTSPGPEQVQSVVRAWYRRNAAVVFRNSLEQWFPALELPESRRPALKIRAMRRRWGSCASHGGINLNLWLIRAPGPCVDYVVVHELCHLREFNHSPAFHAWMDRVMPDWRTHRDALREHERKVPMSG